LAVVAFLIAAWFGWRQPETLPVSQRSQRSLTAVARAVAEVLRCRITLCYTLATGAVFGAIICYLGTAQQIFVEQYGVGQLFPVYFGACAFSLGVASFVNARLVMRFGMRALSRLAVMVEVVVAIGFLLTAFAFGGHPPLPLFMAGLMICFFCNGLLFGNYNARAMQPMGHIAGVAAAVCGSLSGLVAMLIGTPLGRAYDGTVVPVLGAFAAFSLSAFLLTELAEWGGRAED
jgi:DHA1 family bicyclomycin/chloramphenicol resistance-like MFS transporter